MSSAAQLIEEEKTPLNVLELPPGPMPYNTNRRFIPRLRSPFSVKVVGEETHFYGIDISFGGLMASTDEPIWPGNIVDLYLLLPGEKVKSKVSVRVVELLNYRSQIAMRMRFENPSKALRRKIADWMGRLAQQSC